MAMQLDKENVRMILMDILNGTEFYMTDEMAPTAL